MRAKPTLPAPPGVNVPAPKLFGWLASFNDVELARTVIHFYRDYPVIDRRLIGDSKPKLIALFDNSEGAVWTHSADWEEFILKNQEWGGSGKYKVIVTELGVAGAISMSKFKIEDGDYPSRVDPRIVVMGHPENKGYIEGRRAEGIRFPGDDPAADRIEQEEHEEMTVATEVVGVLKEALAEQRQDAAELREQVSQMRVASPPSSEGVATNAAVGVVAEGARTAIEMIAKQADKAHPQPFDVVEIFKVGMHARGEDNGLAIAKLFMDSQKETLQSVQAMHHETIEFLSKRDEAEEPAPETQVATSGTDSLLNEMKRLREMADLFGWKVGGRSEPAAPAPNPTPSWIDKIGNYAAEHPQILMAGLALVANIFYNVRSSTPQDPKEALAKAQNGQLPGTPPQPSAQPAQPSPQHQQQAQQQLEAFMNFFTPAFLNHYSGRDRDLDGYTLAADIHTMIETPSGPQLMPGAPASPLGTDQYKKILEMGMAGFDRLLRQWPPIWSAISNSPHTAADPVHYTQFLNEFFTYYQYAKLEAEAEAGLRKMGAPIAG